MQWILGNFIFRNFLYINFYFCSKSPKSPKFHLLSWFLRIGIDLPTSHLLFLRPSDFLSSPLLSSLTSFPLFRVFFASLLLSTFFIFSLGFILSPCRPFSRLDHLQKREKKNYYRWDGLSYLPLSLLNIFLFPVFNSLSSGDPGLGAAAHAMR